MPTEGLRDWIRKSWRRLGTSAMPIAQCAVAAGTAWLVATDVVGHDRPFFAPIAAIISLGVAMGNRLRRVVELIVGVSLGVLIGDLLISRIGSGAWQITVVVALAMAVAVLADGGALLVGQAASSAVLVATLLPPTEVGGLQGGFERCIDALVGGGLGLLAAALLPGDPVRPLRRDARRLLNEIAEVLYAAADALRKQDVAAAGAALERARASQPMVDAVRDALRAGREVVTVAPLRRRRRRVINRYAEITEWSDYAMRNARVLVRRVYSALSDGEPTVPELVDAVTRVANAVGALTEQLTQEGDRTRAREPVLDAFPPVAALSERPNLGLSEQVVVAQLRSIILDLLQATGLRRSVAIAMMRERAAADSPPHDT